jgi:hypothetical protein
MNIGFLVFMDVLLSEDSTMRIPCIPPPAVKAVRPLPSFGIIRER